MKETGVVDSQATSDVERHPRRSDIDLPLGLLRRHLGLPVDSEWTSELATLAAAAENWYREQGRPWSARREIHITRIGDATIDLEGGTRLTSRLLAAGLREVSAHALVVVAISAGPEVDREIDRRWKSGRPDEAMFLNAYAVTLTEHLRSRETQRLGELARRDGEIVLPHYSPGYEGWDLDDQGRLNELIVEALETPGPLEVLPSGGLRPMKSTLAVFGVTRAAVAGSEDLSEFWNRRAAPANDAARKEVAAPRRDPPAYAVRERTLQLWASRRLTVTDAGNDRLRARFRFDGTTCSSMGLPLAFDYEVELRRERWDETDTYRVLACRCAPATGDTGHRGMCSYLDAPERFTSAMLESPSWTGKTLDDLLEWTPVTSLSGCLCTRASRDHKWRLVLHTLHYQSRRGFQPLREEQEEEKETSLEGSSTLKNRTSLEGSSTLKNRTSLEGSSTLKNRTSLEGSSTLKNRTSLEGSSTFGDPA